MAEIDNDRMQRAERILHAHDVNEVPDVVSRDDALRAIAAALRSRGAASTARDREQERARFPDAGFNQWLDQGISDAGHTVYDAVPDIACAWAGWEARQFAGDAVLLARCCGREECGGECGNEWTGVDMYRKPEAAQAVPEGWQLVPVEATDDMLHAAAFGVSGKSGQKFRPMMSAGWAAMLAAAPKPEQSA